MMKGGIRISNMVFKQKKKKAIEEVESEIKETMQKETPTEESEEAAEESKDKSEEDPAQPPVVGYPIFPTQADINRLVYENNQMLKMLVEYIQKEE